MCGLNLTFSSADNVIKMNQAIAHRGIRSQHLSIGNIHLGHVRLPIQGTSVEHDQPFCYKNWVFLFVGELYNYKQVCPKAKSDIEALASSWSFFGLPCMYLFDGMWSIIAHNKDTKETHVVTDFLAKKPLYYNVHTHSISSEIKALCVNGDRLSINTKYLSRVCKWGYCTHGGTCFNEIVHIPPCSHWVFKDGKLTKRSWTRLKPRPSGILVEIKNSIRNRLVSDVPISLLLSGGIDSSILFKTMVKLTKSFSIFHIDNGEEEFLNYLSIPSSIPVIKLPNPSDSKASDILKKVLYYNESPVDLGSMLSQFLIGRSIQKHGIQVAMSGDGADELFGGYQRSFLYDSQQSDIFEELVYYHLPRLDKLMMASTIELRAPFLSRGIIEASLSIPYQDRINKSVLRKEFSGLLPQEILDRKKFPLKSPQVVQGGLQWRYQLVNKFVEEIIPLYLKGEKP